MVWRVGDRALVPFGKSGVLPAEIIGWTQGGAIAICRVDQPSNADWHRETLLSFKAELQKPQQMGRA